MLEAEWKLSQVPGQWRILQEVPRTTGFTGNPKKTHTLLFGGLHPRGSDFQTRPCAQIAIVNDLSLEEQWYVYHKTRTLAPELGGPVQTWHQAWAHSSESRRRNQGSVNRFDRQAGGWIKVDRGSFFVILSSHGLVH